MFSIEAVYGGMFSIEAVYGGMFSIEAVYGGMFSIEAVRTSSNTIHHTQFIVIAFAVAKTAKDSFAILWGFVIFEVSRRSIGVYC